MVPVLCHLLGHSLSVQIQGSCGPEGLSQKCWVPCLEHLAQGQMSTTVRGKMQTFPPLIMGNKGAPHELFQKLRVTLWELRGDLSMQELELVHVIIKTPQNSLFTHPTYHFCIVSQ